MKSRSKAKFATWVPSSARKAIEYWLSIYPPADSNNETHEVLGRLASDLRMQDAYSQMVFAFSSEQQFDTLIQAAVTTWRDYAELRSQLKLARELRDRIVDYSYALLQALTRLQKLVGYDEAEGECAPLNFPLEIFQLDELCRRDAIDAEAAFDRLDAQILACAGMAVDTSSDAKGGIPTSPNEFGFTEETVNAIGNDLGLALICSGKIRDAKSKLTPRTKDVVRSIAKSATEWQPDGICEFSAALSSRKNSRKMQFIRAFSYNLDGNTLHPINRSKNVDKIIATVADVVLNDPRDSVSTADVRHALGRRPTRKRNIRHKLRP